MSLPDLLADAHLHLFRHGFHGNRPEHEELNEYLSLRERFGIGQGLVVGYEGQEQFVGNNVYLLEISRDYDWMVPLRYVGSHEQDLTDLEPEFFGYAIYLDDWPRSLEWARALNGIAERSLSSRPLVSINGSPETLDFSRPSLSGFDDCQLIISHLGLPGSAVKTTREALERVKPILKLAKAVELSVKISGLYTFDPSNDGEAAAVYVEALLDALGPTRLLWGSDFAPSLDHLPAERAFALPEKVDRLFSPDERELVTSGNLANLLEP